MLYLFAGFLLLGVFLGAVYMGYRATNKKLMGMAHNNTSKKEIAINAVRRKSDNLIKKSTFTVKTEEDANIAGYVAEPYGTVKGIIIICHNYGGSKDKVWRYTSFLCEAGYRVVGFDFRGHGDSDGAENGLHFNHIADLDAIVEYVNRINLESLPVGLFGMSMGAEIGLMYAATDGNIKAVVADGGPLLYKNDYLEYLANITGIKNSISKLIFKSFSMMITDIGNVTSKIRKSLVMLSNRPILFIQGQKDFMNPPRNIFKALDILNSSNAECWVIKDANHLTGFAMEKDEYKRRVIDFFDWNLLHQSYIYSYADRKFGT